MNPLEAALAYARSGRRVFPCRDKNNPRVKWREAATTDERRITEWWSRRPRDLIGSPTGKRDVVLDVDPPAGLDALDELGFPFWFQTPTATTPRGGLHAHFAVPVGNIRNTVGKRGRGIGVNLDWRGLGGYVLLPGAGKYRWDPHLGPDTLLAEVPAQLLPREPRQPALASRPVRPTTGLSPYADAALDSACRRIIAAAAGEQEITLNGETFAIGTLASAGVIPFDFARRVLLWAARQMRDYDHRHPWRAAEIERKVNHAYEAGLRHPRAARCA
jgi:Bifunctional DNA primase/polymerase, N-terminal